MKIFIRILPLFCVLYLFVLGCSEVGPGIGPGSTTPLLLTVSFWGTLIGSIGVLFLKNWARRITIISMFGFLFYIPHEFMKYHKYSIAYIMQHRFVLGLFIFPLIIIVYLFIPKVKKQFK